MAGGETGGWAVDPVVRLRADPAPMSAVVGKRGRSRVRHPRKSTVVGKRGRPRARHPRKSTVVGKRGRPRARHPRKSTVVGKRGRPRARHPRKSTVVGKRGRPRARHPRKSTVVGKVVALRARISLQTTTRSPEKPSADAETGLAGRLLLGDDQVIDVRLSRSAPRPGDQCLDVSLRSLEDGLDGAVVAIGHPAGDAAPLGLLAAGVAIEDALDATGGHHASSNHVHSVPMGEGNRDGPSPRGRPG